MFSDLSDAALLHHLENLADQLGIEVRYENLADEEISIQSGGCKVLGKTLILVEKLRSPREQAQILARELSKYDLEDLLPPSPGEGFHRPSGAPAGEETPPDIESQAGRENDHPDCFHKKWRAFPFEQHHENGQANQNGPGESFFLVDVPCRKIHFPSLMVS